METRSIAYLDSETGVTQRWFPRGLVDCALENLGNGASPQWPSSHSIECVERHLQGLEANVASTVSSNVPRCWSTSRGMLKLPAKHLSLFSVLPSETTVMPSTHMAATISIVESPEWTPNASDRRCPGGRPDHLGHKLVERRTAPRDGGPNPHDPTKPGRSQNESCLLVPSKMVPETRLDRTSKYLLLFSRELKYSHDREIGNYILVAFCVKVPCESSRSVLDMIRQQPTVHVQPG